MHPSERIKHIRAIASELSKEEWNIINLTLRQFGLPRFDDWHSDANDYVIEMLSDADDSQLLDLAIYLGVASQRGTALEPDCWSADEVRIFLSHLATMKAEVSQIKDALENYGIKAFVAHEDIEPSKEWQTEIESALSTMDGLVALLESV